ncbi:MAG TPA: GIY-YIG nuclease family protein [Stenotrophobium sp.]|jgi:putative endonuclease|nr:GIY-YIG nuclease family protein [Stenotrophobium sp.]
MTPTPAPLEDRDAAPVTWSVYMLECARGRLYTGIAIDVAARFAKHCRGRGAAFTRANTPLRVIAAMPCGDRSAASKTESRLKKLRRPDKLRWAAQWPWTPHGAG